MINECLLKKQSATFNSCWQCNNSISKSMIVIIDNNISTCIHCAITYTHLFSYLNENCILINRPFNVFALYPSFNPLTIITILNI